MREGVIRPLVIGIFGHEGRILVEEGVEPSTGRRFYRPLGGEIEFGEHSRDALIRELQEEIGAAITHLHLLGTLENFFTFEGVRGHEIVLVYDAAFVDQTLYERAQIVGSDTGGVVIRAGWKRLDEFGPDDPPLFPDGLPELLRELGF